VLDRLERADRPAELHPASSRSRQPSRAPGRRPPTCSAARPTAARSSTFDNVAAPPPSPPTSRAGNAVELQPRLLAGLVHGRQWGAHQAGRRAVDGEDADPGVRACADEDQPGHVPVQHEALHAVDHPAVAGAGGGGRDAALVQRPESSVVGERRASCPRTRCRAAGPWPPPRRRSRGSCSRPAPPRRSTARTAGHGPSPPGTMPSSTKLNPDRRIPRVSRAPADRSARHLAPDGRVVPRLVRHEPADLRLGRPVGEKTPARYGAVLPAPR